MSSPAIAPHPAVAGRSLLTLRHHPPDAVVAILDLADRLKAERASGWPPLLAGRVVALIFERPSTRTRVSFASGIARLAGTSLALSAQDLQLGRGETVEDTAKVLGRMVDAIVLRTGPHATLEELDRNAGRAGHQRPDLRAPPLPGAGRRADPARALRRSLRACGSPTWATATTAASR